VVPEIKGILGLIQAGHAIYPQRDGATQFLPLLGLFPIARPLRMKP